MMHSKEYDGKEILASCDAFTKFVKKVFLIAAPSTYNHTTENQLSDAGVNLVIYANHLLRSAYPAMVNTAKSILENERAKEADENCMPIKEILHLIPGGE